MSATSTSSGARLVKHGRKPVDLMRRIAGLTRRQPCGCLVWMGATARGLPVMSLINPSTKKRTVTTVRRVVYAQVIGPISEGHDVFTTCTTPLCVSHGCLASATRAERFGGHATESAGKAFKPQARPITSVFDLAEAMEQA